MITQKPAPTQANHTKPRPHHDQDQNDYQLQQQPKQLQGFNELPVQQSEESEEGDILEKIDSLLEQNCSNGSNENEGNARATQKEMLLNFKINEMQKIIQNLNEANKKLNRKLEEQYSESQAANTHKNNESSNVLNSSSESSPPFCDELTQMQGDFQQIQTLIKDYKEQLANSEKKWNAIKQEKDEEIQSLKNQLIALSQTNELAEQELNQISEENQTLKNKNEQLLLQLQNLEHQLEGISENSQRQYQSPGRYSNYYETPAKKFQSLEDYRFNQKIQRQMESMIKKLLKELGHERKVNSKIGFEAKRLNNELLEMERKLKAKNDTIYQLEMKLIQVQKTYNIHLPYNPNSTKRYAPTTISNHNSSIKYSPKVTSKAGQLTPTHNKNESLHYQSTIYHNNKHRNKHQNQQILMKEYEAQYTEYSQSLEGNYDDYVSLPMAMKNKSPIKIKQTNKTQLAANTNKPIEHPPFIKHKKPQQAKQPITTKPITNATPKQFLTFTLMQLHEGKIKITMKQKIIIISKIIDLYCKKIKNHNHYNLIAEEIQVYNFSDKHPNLIRLKIVDSNPNNKTDLSSTLQDETQESLMYNLAFIVENLVKEVDTLDQKDLEVDLNLADIIEDILAKSQQDKIAYFQQLSKSLENSVITLQ